MTREVGVWIDHRKAVIAIIAGKTEEVRQVTSSMEKHVRYSGAAQEDSAEDQRDKRFTGHLNKYYDQVIGCIRDADSILMFGPGEAKIELEDQLRGIARLGAMMLVKPLRPLGVALALWKGLKSGATVYRQLRPVRAYADDERRRMGVTR